MTAQIEPVYLARALRKFKKHMGVQMTADEYLWLIRSVYAAIPTELAVSFDKWENACKGER